MPICPVFVASSAARPGRCLYYGPVLAVASAFEERCCPNDSRHWNGILSWFDWQAAVLREPIQSFRPTKLECEVRK